MMVKFGSIYYSGSMLIRHLCEHDNDILFTFAFKMAEFYRLYRFAFVAKKHSFLTASIFRSTIN